MKAKTLLLFVSFVCVPAFYAQGQLTCLSGDKDSNKLVCELPTTSNTVAAAAIGVPVIDPCQAAAGQALAVVFSA